MNTKYAYMKVKQLPLRRVWISHKYKLAYNGIPKTGSTSVRAMLDMAPESDYRTVEDYKRDHELYSDYLLFTVLRNPILRAVSSYEECKRRGTLRHRRHTFEEFLHSIKDHGFFDEHARPQLYYYSAFDAEEYDLVFRLEDDLHGQLEKLTGTTLQKCRLNSSNLDEYRISQEAGELISDIYKNDFLIYENNCTGT